MLSDPLADLLTRIKNAAMAKHQGLEVPYSRNKEELVKLLVKTGRIGSYEVIGLKTKRQLAISKLNLESAKRLSKPGMRLYAGYKELSLYLRGRGETILSTSKGLMTARDAYKQKLGGELLCKVV
ncbi:MAG: 30S ribosomal protein S8 [Patescibacteria group bacterium]|nr:30S ribosomal protein S8 [Patescibacteria group bacterium]MDP4030769.1 30S ribosomal protein S8 [Candidatus Beckwithbacteria bacterium]MDZ4228689.1 30S ribosomal protein S8 [Patescibacteria group bacterium]